MGDIENKRMGRRRFIRTCLYVAAGAALGVLGGELLNSNKKISLEELERLALETHKGLDLKVYDGDTVSDINEYELHFSVAMGIAFSYQSYLEQMKKRFPKDKELLVADIGGAEGAVAENLNKIPGVEAFVIDPANKIPRPGQGLPRERFIIREIEYTGLPDNVFHCMTSYNTYGEAELPRSFTKVHRLLRPGGAALIEYEHWCKPEVLDQLDALEIKDEVMVGMRTITEMMSGKRCELLTLDDFISIIRETRREINKEEYAQLGASAQVYFMIGKTK